MATKYPKGTHLAALNRHFKGKESAAKIGRNRIPLQEREHLHLRRNRPVCTQGDRVQIGRCSRTLENKGWNRPIEN